MKKSSERGEQPGLNEDEIAFYDALEVIDSAVQALGEPTLKTIARESVKSVRSNLTIDWTCPSAGQAQGPVVAAAVSQLVCLRCFAVALRYGDRAHSSNPA